MSPQPTPPALFFAVPFLAVVLLCLHISAFFRPSAPAARTPTATRQLVAVSFIVSLSLLSTIAGAFGLAAYNDASTKDASHVSAYLTGECIVLSFIQLELGVTVVYLLLQHSLIDSLAVSSHYLSQRLRPIVVVLSIILGLRVIFQVVFASIKAPYPASCIPAIFSFLFLGPTLYLVYLLYRRAKAAHEPARLSFLWLALGVSQLAGFLGAAFTFAESDPMRIPEALFTVISIASTLLACHGLFTLPPNLSLPLTPVLPSMLTPSSPSTFLHSDSPRRSRPFSRTSNVSYNEDFLHLTDPFASPRGVDYFVPDAGSIYAMTPRSSTLIIEKAPSPLPSARLPTKERVRYSERCRSPLGSSASDCMNGLKRKTMTRSQQNLIGSRKASASTLSPSAFSAFGSSPSLIESENEGCWPGEMVEIARQNSGFGLGLGVALPSPDAQIPPSGVDADEQRAEEKDAQLSQMLLKALESGTRPASAPGTSRPFSHALDGDMTLRLVVPRTSVDDESEGHKTV